MANKIRYGIRNVKYALYDGDTSTYGAFKSFPGAVSLSLSREGGDNSDFYADDGIYFTFAGTNGGYSGDLEMARLTDEVRRDLLGEIVDSDTGVQFETTGSEAKQFAMVVEMQGDQNPIGFVFYNCKVARPEWNANTKNENPSVDTDTLAIRIGAQPFEFGASIQNFVQGHIEKTSTNAAQFEAFFSAVVIPGVAGSTGSTAGL